MRRRSSLVIVYSADPVNRSETTTDGVRKFCVWFGSSAIGVSLGSTTMGDFARVDVHAGEYGRAHGSWKRMRSDGESILPLAYGVNEHESEIERERYVLSHADACVAMKRESVSFTAVEGKQGSRILDLWRSLAFRLPASTSSRPTRSSSTFRRFGRTSPSILRTGT
jgi:hypothetical protein